MSFTTGFLLLFFTIVIPGFLFLRAYYYGEFSKQFNPRENITRHLLFALIPGSIIQLLIFFICRRFEWIKLDGTQLITVFETVNKQNINGDESAKNLLSDPTNFVYYLLIVYGLSFLFGSFFSRSIRSIRWDKKFKVLRYKNQWYYIFSGEIFEFKKFKSAANILGKASLQDQKIQLAKADVLINNGGKQELYSGYVVDYDLKPEDSSKLDHLYLMDAYRYSQLELKNHNSELVHPHRVEKRHIPGEIFVLNMDSIINMNVSYLLSPVEPPNHRRRNFYLRVLNTLVFSILIALIYPIFFLSPFIKADWYIYFHDTARWWDKLTLFLACMSVLSFLVSEKNKDSGNYEFTWNAFKINLIALPISLGLFWGIYFLF